MTYPALPADLILLSQSIHSFTHSLIHSSLFNQQSFKITHLQTMLLHLDRQQMLEQWRLHRSHLPSYSNSLLSRSDTLDSDSYFEAEMALWYRRILLEAPHQLLKVTDISGSIMFFKGAAADGATSITLPADVVRVTAIRLSSWMRPARIVTDPSDALILRQLHPYTRATSSRPVALHNDNQLRIYPAASLSDNIITLSVITFTDGLYEFDSSLLSQIHPS